jgi:signal transduction histidine kinase
MENALLKGASLRGTFQNTLNLIIHSDTYSIAGHWKSSGTIGRWESLTDVQKKGLSFNYLIGIHGQNYLVHPDDICIFTDLTNQLANGNEIKLACRIVSPDGEIRRIDGSGALTVDSPMYRQQYLSDSSSKERSTDFENWAFDVHRSKQLLQSIFQASPVGMSVAKAVRDENQKIIDFEIHLANKATEEQLTLSDLQGKKCSEALAFLSPQISLAEFIDVVDNDASVKRQISIRHGNQTRWLKFVVVKFDDGILIVSEDISDRVETEMQVRQQTSLVAKVIESSPDVIQIVNLASGKSAYINKMLLEELGYPFEQIKKIEQDNSLTEIIHEEDAGHYENFLKEIRTAGNDDTIEVELRWRTFTGRYVWFRTRAKVFERRNDVPVKIIAFSQNVTDKKLAEEEKRNHQLLKEMEKARTAFFSNVSHEFRTPLTLLLAPIEETIKTQALPKNEMNQLQMAYRNALRLQKLVNTLLDFARIESGKTEAVFHPTDLSSFTADLASNFRTIIEQSGLKFKVKCEKADDPVYVNREMYEKIVFNLLSNAYKYTFEGTIEIILRENKNHVKLIVRDTGIGISNDHIQKIFDRFVRIEGVKARTYEGSGIGLSLVKELIAIHRGNIKVSSSQGEGTEFVVTFFKGKDHLPSKNIHESKGVAANSTSQINAFVEELTAWTVGLQENEPRTGKTKSSPNDDEKPFVLVVDDNSDMRTYLKNLLSEKFNVTVAANGKAAIESIDGEKLPDLILTDVMMPEVNGYELLKAIKTNELTKHIPVILISARAGEQSTIEGMGYGADDYIVKPFSANEMLARVDARIQISRSHHMIKQLLLGINKELEEKVTLRTKELLDANSALAQKNAELQNLNTDLSTFTFVASHDLTEPLRKIQVFAQMLLHREGPNLSEKAKDILNKIFASIERMKTLTHEILTYSESQSQPNLKHLADLNEIIDQVQRNLHHSIADKHAVIEFYNLPSIKCNPLQISQLFQNLISNSLKFSKPEVAPKIYITSSIIDGRMIDHPMVSARRRYLKIEVKDNGIGFDTKYKEKIFQMFQQLHNRSTYPGTGMGLAICKKVMENHHGLILTSSQPGEGSIFCCYFPEELLTNDN